jgi:pseudouridine synthase
MLHDVKRSGSRRRCSLLGLLAVLGRSDTLLRYHHVIALSSPGTLKSRRSQTRRSFGVAVGARGKRGAVSPDLSSDAPQKKSRVLEANEFAERTVVLLYHKPPDVVTSHNASNDPLRRRTVYDDVQTMAGYIGNTAQEFCRAKPTTDASFHEVTRIRPATRIHAVGRLDAETTGLLLLTNDGKLVHHVTNSNTDGVEGGRVASSEIIDKTYEAVIMGHHNETSPLLERVRRGVDLGPKHGGQTRPPRSLAVLSHPTRTTTLVRLTISEGKNRQVRQMFHRVGSGVMRLTRVQIGRQLTLEGIEEEGSWRILSDAEVRDTLGWTPRVLEQSSSSFVARAKPSGPGPRKRRQRRRHD